MTALAVEAGFTGDLCQADHWGISWHADYAWLGTIHTQAMATPEDANYNPITKGCNGKCLPLANYLGSGHDTGVMLTLEPHYDYAGWRFGVEGGPYIHRSIYPSVDMGRRRDQVGLVSECGSSEHQRPQQSEVEPQMGRRRVCRIQELVSLVSVLQERHSRVRMRRSGRERTY
ncbi:hypothetical protein [Paraburkholderia sp.]|uniref:hypothetical protein n=1 Tax=Paraburkholderia sp. TaxID=1926495 RepID=UPI0025FF9C54|nr:hypothetical protein [Paraburkholderia sp.]